MHLRALLAVVALGVVATACSGSTHANAAKTTPLLGAPDPSLVAATYPQCGTGGQAVEEYLLRGNNGGDPQLDENYATERASILGQPSAARAGLARADADTAIQSCDQQLSDKAAAAAQAAQARAEALAQQRAAAAGNAQFGVACRSHGGTLVSTEPDNIAFGASADSDAAGDYCGVTYRGASYGISMTDNNQWDAAAAAYNKTTCISTTETAQTAAQDGYPWSQLPMYHSDSGVCEPGSP